jgi:hypothetical protein
MPFALFGQAGRHGRKELAAQLLEELSGYSWGIAARNECALDDL